MERKGRNLIPTKAGVNLVTVLPELLTSPKLTADWGAAVERGGKGSGRRGGLLDGIEAMAAGWCGNIPTFPRMRQSCSSQGRRWPLCPRCGKQVL